MKEVKPDSYAPKMLGFVNKHRVSAHYNRKPKKTGRSSARSNRSAQSSGRDDRVFKELAQMREMIRQKEAAALEEKMKQVSAQAEEQQRQFLGALEQQN